MNSITTRSLPQPLGCAPATKAPVSVYFGNKPEKAPGKATPKKHSRNIFSKLFWGTGSLSVLAALLANYNYYGGHHKLEKTDSFRQTQTAIMDRIDTFENNGRKLNTVYGQDTAQAIDPQMRLFLNSFKEALVLQAQTLPADFRRRNPQIVEIIKDINIQKDLLENLQPEDRSTAIHLMQKTLATQEPDDFLAIQQEWMGLANKYLSAPQMTSFNHVRQAYLASQTQADELEAEGRAMMKSAEPLMGVAVALASILTIVLSFRNHLGTKRLIAAKNLKKPEEQ